MSNKSCQKKMERTLLELTSHGYKGNPHISGFTATYKIYEVIQSVRLNRYPKHDAFLFETVGDAGRNPWTMKCRSQRPTKI